MRRDGKFKAGESGNPTTQFKPGNPHRWQPGQSGNPDGIARRRVEFEKAFYAALLGQGTPEEAASLLWAAARKGEPWAVQLLLQRLAPETKQINTNHGFQDEEIDYERLSDEDLASIRQIAERAKALPSASHGGASTSQLQGVCDSGSHTIGIHLAPSDGIRLELHHPWGNGTHQGTIPVSITSKFKPGQSGNPKTQFKAGNPHRWQSGQSGNPSGMARRRREFQERFSAALLEQASPEEAARLLCEAARDREPWAVQALVRHLAPEAQTHQRHSWVTCSAEGTGRAATDALSNGGSVGPSKKL